MRVSFKPLDQQVIVLTGATSGIGLATTRALAQRGAKLVLVARNSDELESLVKECRQTGTQAIAAPADVGHFDQVGQVATRAIEAFGGFDTWINNAGVAIYGTCDEIPLEDHRRLFETNYWGVVHGSLVAARHLRRKGGKIINTGSVLSDRAMIFQGPYSASKHAVKGFTDALRMELEEANDPVSVTLIKPSAINTPYMEHARNYLDSVGTKNPPPSYDPELVAKAMVFACENDRRDIVVGFGGWAVSAMGAVAPRMTDLVMEATGRTIQESSDPGQSGRRDNLYSPREDGAQRSSLAEGTRKSSLFLEAQLTPFATLVETIGLSIGAIAVRHVFGRDDTTKGRSVRHQRR